MPSSTPSKPEVLAAVNAVRKVRLPLEWEPMSIKQVKSIKPRPVRGPIWSSHTTFSPEGCQDILRIVNDAAHDLAFDTGHHDFTPPSLAEVHAEWIGRREGVGATELEPPDLSEKDKYERLMQEVSSPLVVLYLFGGNLHVGSSSTYRTLLTPLVTLTGGRILIVNYRLAPRCTFPSPLIDALIAYLSLLYPSPSAAKDAVPASNIILAGDSAGADLCLSLLQIILSSRRTNYNPFGTNPTLTFRGHHVRLPMPAGLTLLSTAPDLSGSMWSPDLCTDIIEATQPCLHPSYPPCELWPSDPPRENLYCAGPLLSHPLVSPITASDWTGACPVYMFIGGGERSNADARFLAKQMSDSGVRVRWQEYEAMPHLWPFIFQEWMSTKRCWKNWGQACAELIGGELDGASTARVIRVPDGEAETVDLGRLTGLTMQDVRGHMREFQRKQKPFLGRKKSRSSL